MCDQCGKELVVGEWPFCPHGTVEGVAIIGDECDVVIKHGICNPDGTPKRYRSKSEIREAAFNAGLLQGGDTPKVNSKLIDQREEAKHSQRQAQREGRY